MKKKPDPDRDGYVEKPGKNRKQKKKWKRGKK